MDKVFSSDPFMQTAMARFKLVSDAENKTREKAFKDLKFRLGEQWDTNVSIQRQLEKRPCLTINRIPQFVRQVTNDQRMNRPSIKVLPVGDSDYETAQVYQGLVRHIEVSSNADIAYDTACDHQVTMGFGFIKIGTDYADDDTFDQEIRIKRVKNPFSVFLDPMATEPDGSDAKWAFGGFIDMKRDDFKRQYPKASETLEFDGVGLSIPGWLNDQIVRVAEYWVVEEKAAKIYLLSDGSKVDSDEYEIIKDKLPEAGVTVERERETVERKVKCYKITAVEKLEESEWAGKYIPIVPVYGEDYDVDGERELIGMVRYMHDSQRMFNYWTTAQTEMIALAPKAPYIAAEGQLEGFEKDWQSSNVKTHAYLYYKPRTSTGEQLPPPQRQFAEPPVQAMVQAIAQASDNLKSTTGIYDSSLGNRSNETSGKAILARQKEGDVANFHYIDNLSRAIRHVGVILVDLIPRIYDSARVLRILKPDGESEVVAVNGAPVPQGVPNAIQKVFDLTAGKYDVVVETGPSFTTKRQEAAESMIQLVQANPALMNVIGDIMVRNMDWPDSKEAAERLKMMLPPNIVDAKDKDKQIPPQVKGLLDQQQAMIEQLTNALNASRQEVEGKKLELQSRERINAQNNAVKLAIEESRSNQALLGHEIGTIKATQAALQAPVDNNVNGGNNLIN